MQALRVAPARGWYWITEGWRLFVKEPGLWVLLIVIYLAIQVVLSLIPVVGSLANALLGPALAGGLLVGAARLDQGRALEVGHLFHAFREPTLTRPMLTLGAISLGATVLMVLVCGGAVLSSLVGVGMLGPEHPDSINVVAGAGFAGLLVALAIGVVLSMALLYGIPLVMFEGMAPAAAVRASFSATLTNVLPLTVFGLISLGLAILAAIPMGLGFLVLGPVTVGAVYASYRDLFPRPGSNVTTVPD